MGDIRDRLKEILINNSILKGEFKLASGKKSDYYIDARLTTLDPEGVNLISRIFFEEIVKDAEIDCVGGPTMGADPIVGSLISYSHETKRPLKGFLVRKEEKEHGTTKLIEGSLKSGDKVAVIEDVITTGGSVFKAIKAIESAGGEVVKVLVVVNREESNKSLFKDKGYVLYSIFDVEELL
ncbi:MAG: orotate phosphoribosyltransferase [Candidatus Dadabacteria bacterium]|nr:orotate phosphoribosyltransferase [Candidatus Dadabacteria bacterium]NIQ13473.1 orotate phosphoribosyltransferase [Candidatus Dadabacteria bacterium]